MLNTSSIIQKFAYFPQQLKKLAWEDISYLSLLSCLCGIFTVCLSASAGNDYDRQLEFQDAAQYTHLKWPHSVNSKITVKLSPIENFSGIPIEAREEKAEYYYHGKLPEALNTIYADAFYASQFFLPSANNADYEVALYIDEYQLPFKYAPDDIWWKTVQDKTDRWLQEPSATQVKLSIKITSGKKNIKPWMDSVSMSLTQCDLNQYPQPSSHNVNSENTVRTYLSTTPGQTFLAATNFLILKAIQRIQEEPVMGIVARKLDQEIYLSSNNMPFTVGENLKIYFSQDQQPHHTVSYGEVKVFRTEGEQAIAYPLNLRADHIVEGDWVGIGLSKPITKPMSRYKPATACAQVITAQVN